MINIEIMIKEKEIPSTITIDVYMYDVTHKNAIFPNTIGRLALNFDIIRVEVLCLRQHWIIIYISIYYYEQFIEVK